MNVELLVLKQLKKHSLFLLGTLPLLAGAILTRLPYFIFYPIAGFGKDTFSYYLPYKQFVNGDTPLFDLRTPGYTIFIGLLDAMGASSSCIVIVQCVITLLCFYFLLHTLHKHFDFIVFVSCSFALFLFYTSADLTRFDTSVLTEGLYANAIILSLTLLIDAIFNTKTKQSALLLSLSLSAGVLVLIRPQGLFFVPILIVFSGYLYYFSKSIKLALQPIAPFMVVMLLLFSYNLMTFGSFSFSAFGPVNKLGTEVTYMSTSDKYDPQVNEIITRIQSNFPEGYVNFVNDSWEYEELKKGFSVHDSSLRMIYEIQHKLDLNYYESSKIIDQVAEDAAIGNSVLYLKFVMTSFIGFHLNFVEQRHFYFNMLINRCGYFADGSMRNYTDDESVKLAFKEYSDYVDGDILAPGCAILMNENYVSKTFPDESIFLKTPHYFSILVNALFRNVFWIVLFSISYLIAIFKLLTSKFKDRNAFVLFMVGNILILSSILVAMVQLPFNRYSAPTDFAYYLAVALLPSLFLKKDGQVR